MGSSVDINRNSPPGVVRERSGRWANCGSDAIARNGTPSRDSQTTHLEARQRMKNVSTKIAAATSGATAQSQQSIAERRRYGLKRARERAERERREIRRELSAAGLL